MKREEIIEKVNSLLSEEFEVDAARFTPDANVRETLSLDSLSLVDLVGSYSKHIGSRSRWPI